MHSKLILLLLVFASTCFGASAEIDIQRDVHFNKMPPPSVGNIKVFIYFEGSSKATMILQEKLLAQGVMLAESEADADLKFKMSGVFMLSGAGKEPVNGSLGDLLEKSIDLSAAENPDYKNASVSLAQIAATSGLGGAISLSDMVLWLSQKVGVAGWINKQLSGDVRGFCWHESCNKFTHTVIVRVNGSGYGWWIQETATDEKIVLDLLIEDIIETAMTPLSVIKTSSSSLGKK